MKDQKQTSSLDNVLTAWPTSAEEDSLNSILSFDPELRNVYRQSKAAELLRISPAPEQAITRMCPWHSE